MKQLLAVTFVLLISGSVSARDFGPEVKRILHEIQQNEANRVRQEQAVKEFETVLLQQDWYKEKYQSWRQQEFLAHLRWIREMRQSVEADTLLTAQQKADWHRMLDGLHKATQKDTASVPRLHTDLIEKLRAGYSLAILSGLEEGEREKISRLFRRMVD